MKRLGLTAAISALALLCLFFALPQEGTSSTEIIGTLQFLVQTDSEVLELEFEVAKNDLESLFPGTGLLLADGRTIRSSAEEVPDATWLFLDSIAPESVHGVAMRFADPRYMDVIKGNWKCVKCCYQDENSKCCCPEVEP